MVTFQRMSALERITDIAAKLLTKDDAPRIAANISTRQRQSKPDFDSRRRSFNRPLGALTRLIIYRAEPNPRRPTRWTRLERRLRCNRGLARSTPPSISARPLCPRVRQFRNVFVNTGATFLWSLQPLSALAEGQKAEDAGREARGGGGLGPLNTPKINWPQHFGARYLGSNYPGSVTGGFR